MKPVLCAAALLSILTLSACGGDPASPRGFSLPDGNAVEGETVFLEYGCLTCHTLEGYDRDHLNTHSDIEVALGGKVHRVKTYADLVTSVINPSHRVIGKFPVGPNNDGTQSPMPSFNEVMTVDQMIDLVTFLQDKYELAPYEPTYYPNYQ